MKITIKDLRGLLFEIDNQEMTVKALRLKLFDMKEQEFELNKITKRKLRVI